jgi:hypothetical protein
VCLTCGCMDAHRRMGEANIRFEDVKHGADENGRSVEATLRIMDATIQIDRANHPSEYAPASDPAPGDS